MEDLTMRNVERERESKILHYASISADKLLEKDPEKIEKIILEKQIISSELMMTEEEIILEASRLMSL